MTTAVLLSIDTELTWRAHMSGASWRDNYARSIEPGGVGIGYQLALLAEHDLKACFFVDPLPARLFGTEPIRRMVGTILDAGQEVQLHVHPMWIQADRRAGEPEAPDVRFELTRFSEDEQLALILEGAEMLRAAGAPDPIAFRAGSFGANPDTLRAAARAGMRIDSSHNGSQAPWPCQTGLPRAAVSPLRAGTLTELPVGLLDEGGGKLRHLQIGAVSLGELRAALLHAEREGSPVITLVGHSFELATRDGTRTNDVVRQRFDGLCRWLEAVAERFPTRFAAELADVPVGHPATPYPVPPVMRFGRIAVQGFANLRYERRL